MNKKNKKLLLIMACILLTAGLLFAVTGNDESNLTKNAQKQPEFSFISLGDSIASGIGLPTYVDPSACSRTAESYPQQLASELNASINHLACSGATYYSGVLEPQVVNRLELASQISRLDRNEIPKFITLTAGANDANWVEVIADCYVSDCGSDQETRSIDANLKTVSQGLNRTLEAANEIFPGVPVYVTGYHQVIPADPELQCRDLNGITQAERLWVRDQQAKLNQTLQDETASFDFAQFVGVNFNGHELCTDDPRVQGLSDPAPYHPTAEGHQAYVEPLREAIDEN